MGRRPIYDPMLSLEAWALSREGEGRRSPFQTSGHSAREAKKTLEEAARRGIIDKRYAKIHRVTVNRHIGHLCSGDERIYAVRGHTIYDQCGRVVFPPADIADIELMDPVDVIARSLE